MPLPFMLLGAAAIAGATGVAKGGMATAKNTKAKRIKNSWMRRWQKWEPIRQKVPSAVEKPEC